MRRPRAAHSLARCTCWRGRQAGRWVGRRAGGWACGGVGAQPRSSHGLLASGASSAHESTKPPPCRAGYHAVAHSLAAHPGDLASRTTPTSTACTLTPPPRTHQGSSTRIKLWMDTSTCQEEERKEVRTTWQGVQLRLRASGAHSYNSCTVSVADAPQTSHAAPATPSATPLPCPHPHRAGGACPPTCSS